MNRSGSTETMCHGYLFVFLLGSCVFGALGQENTDCIQSASQELGSCATNHMTWLTDLGKQSGQGGGGAAIMEAMCSKTGKVVIGCFFDAFMKCPVLLTMGSGSSTGGSSTSGSGGQASMTSMLPFNVTEVMDAGGLDKYCDLVTGPCKELMQCFDMVPQDGSAMSSGPDFTPYMTDAAAFNEAKGYLFFQQQTSMACGPMRPMMECMMTVLDDCLSMKVQISEQVDNMMQQTASGIQNVKFMTFDDMMDLVKNQCPLMPKGFGSSDCLQKQMMTSGFTSCHQNFTATYTTTAEKKNCTAYEALEGCFDKNVMPMCGAPVSRFMARNTPLMVDGISSSCVKEINASSKPLATSIMIMMAALFVTMATLL